MEILLWIVIAIAAILGATWLIRKSEDEKIRRQAIGIREHLRRRGLLDRDDVYRGRRPPNFRTW